jgi:two-component system, OmpR family, copper resistance phosphate regulon response regulator CusR
MRILVVEDDKKVARFIAQGFGQEHHAVDIAFDGQRGAELAAGIDYDAVILDLMLPKLPGLQLLEILKQKKPNMPVLVLTAKGELQERIEGLDRGADDYMAKPFAFAELAARVRALLRRGKGEATQIRLADLVLDTSTRTVTRGGRKLDLSSKELALLEFLLRNAKRPVTRTMIIEHVWDIHFDCVTNVVDVYINYLRNKVDANFFPPLIHTVRGVGYMASDEVL